MPFVCTLTAPPSAILSRRGICVRLVKEISPTQTFFYARKHKLSIKTKVSASGSVFFDQHEINDVSLDWEGHKFEEFNELESPWEGAVVYKRSSSVSHIEYCTTLERLGLAKLSSDVSRSCASSMGIRVTNAVKDYPNGTPVQISLDVTSIKQKLRLEGIVKTVVSLNCQSCGEAAAEAVFSNFAVLLSDEVVEESEILKMGDSVKDGEKGESDGKTDVEWDEVLCFPVEDKEMDISKVIRDIVHVEMTMNALCHPNCAGLCTSCGRNLNKGFCNCGANSANLKVKSPFRGLRNQINL